jgi:Amidohydrolase family
VKRSCRRPSRWRRSPAAPELAGTLLKNGTVVDPTLVTLRRLNAWLENPTDPRDKYIAASAWREAATILDPLRKDAAQLLIERRALARETEGVIGELHAAGVRMITGTDLSFTLIHPGFSLHDELEALVDVGLTPLDAIRAATLTPSRLFPHVEGGEIAAGKRANLVLLDDNPFADIRNAGKIRAVVVAGGLHDRASLDRLLTRGGPARGSSLVHTSRHGAGDGRIG